MVTLVIPTDATNVKGPQQGQWTRQDWEKLPDDGNRYEVIEGVLYMSTAPSYFHQWVIQNLYDHLGLPAKQQKLALPIFSPVGVFMPGCGPVQPDFALVLTARSAIIHDRRIWGVPDFIAEVLSPGSKDYDEGVKLATYAKAGVPEYAVTAPLERQLRLYQLVTAGQYPEPFVYGVNYTVTLNCLPTIPVLVGSLFEGAPDTTL
jgi:Uma2 family endonuclease